MYKWEGVPRSSLVLLLCLRIHTATTSLLSPTHTVSGVDFAQEVEPDLLTGTVYSLQEP